MPALATRDRPQSGAHAAPDAAQAPAARWTFFSNHAHVLFCLARDPHARLREVADTVGITERAVQKIVAELESAGVLSRRREGRRNRYTVHRDVPLRHNVEAHRNVGELLKLVLTPAELRGVETETRGT